MSIRDIQFSSLYRKRDDVLHNFYIPALSEASVYKRVSAYFSADVLKLYSKGLSSFIKNGGKIKFIFSHHLTEEDYLKIKQGYDGRYNLDLLKEIEGLEDSVQISNLAYLISHNIVEIKIGFMVPGTLHFKYGLIEDGDDVVCFRGSTNETPSGILLNGENFEVSCSWLCGEHEAEAISGYEEDFDDLWNGNYDGVITVDAPNCVIDAIQSHDKHQLIIDYEDQCENTFILDFDDKMHLIGYSFLENKDLFSPSSLFFKIKLNSFVSMTTGNDIFYFKDLPPSEIKILVSVLESFASEKKFNLKISTALNEYLNGLDLYLKERTTLGYAIKNKDDSVLNKFNEFCEVVNTELTRSLQIPQMWDAFHAVNMVASSNFSVPGTGKTTIAYGAFGYLSSKESDSKIKRIVMIGPKNSFMAWTREFELCFGQKRKLKCFNAQDKKYKNVNQLTASLIQEYKNSNLILINYDKLQNYEVLETLKMLMKQNNFSDYLILDEAHKIKGIEGKRAKAVLSLAPFAKYKLVLTGTPIPNNYTDIYNILNILYGDDYDNFFGFTTNYLASATYIPSRQEEINEKIYPFFCRTTKKDLKVPPADFDYETGKVLMNEKERHLFELIHKNFGYNVLVLYIRLLQASINPLSLLNKLKDNDVLEIFAGIDDGDHDASTEGYDDGDLDYLKETLMTTEKGHKAVLSPEDVEFIASFGLTRKFYKGIDIIEHLVSEGKPVVAWGVFVNTLHCIQDELKRRGISSVIISGEMTDLSEREANIDKFLNREYKVLISNPHTLAESVSLHHACHNAVYFEYTFNLTHLLQSRDRIHRLGLPEGTNTNYYFLSIDNNELINNAIDLKTLERLNEKEQRMLNAIEKKQLFIKQESYLEDINFIFNLNKKED